VVKSLRHTFPVLWAEYLKATYGSAYAVKQAFPEIDAKTARDWVNGKCNPSGCFVAAVVAADPNAIKILGGME
jgi:hypothetical protein